MRARGSWRVFPLSALGGGNRRFFIFSRDESIPAMTDALGRSILLFAYAIDSAALSA